MSRFARGTAALFAGFLLLLAGAATAQTPYAGPASGYGQAPVGYAQARPGPSLAPGYAEPSYAPRGYVAAPGQMCGGLAGVQCGRGSVCVMRGEDHPDRSGVCERTQASPIACTRIYRPVCGVNGRTYPNRCVADSQGAQVRHDGECDRTAPVVCSQIYQPVCGRDGRTFPNRCTAMAAGVSVRHRGECRMRGQAPRDVYPPPPPPPAPIPYRRAPRAQPYGERG
jgi:hypothetical protein